MILNGRNVTLAEKTLYVAHQKNLNEDRPILSAAKCRPIILVPRKYKVYVDTRGGSSGRGVNRQTTISVYACMS